VSVPAQRRRGRPALPKAQQKQRLVAAALRAFESTQFERTTVADIVREAGMSSRSFYEHFASKEDLVAEIVFDYGRALVERIARIYAESGSVVERIDRAVGAFLEVFPAATVDLERLGGEAGQRVREARQHYVQEITDLVFAEVQRLHARGVFSAEPDRLDSELMITGIEGLSFRYYSEGRREELLALRPRILGIVLRVISGRGPAESPPQR